MKKLFLIFSLIFASLIMMGQSTNKVITITADTLNAVETIYFDVQPITGTYQSISITTTFTQLGGTSDGAAYLQASNDGVGYFNITSQAGKYVFFPNDTLTITSGVAWGIQIFEPAFKYYRLKTVGTASDTTLVSPTYIIRK